MSKQIVCNIADLTPNQLTPFILSNGKRVIIVATENGIQAFQGVCPHQNVPLDTFGSLTGNKLTCSLHRFSFDLCSGKYLRRVPKCKNLEIYEVEVSSIGDIFVRIPVPELQISG